MSDWSTFFKPKVYEDPDKDAVELRHYRVDNWHVIQQRNAAGQHRLKVYTRSRCVYTEWHTKQEFASVDLDQDFGTVRGWYIYGCDNEVYHHVFPPVFKVQFALTEDAQPLSPTREDDQDSD